MNTASDPAHGSDAQADTGFTGMLVLWGPLIILVLLIFVYRDSDDMEAVPESVADTTETTVVVAAGHVEAEPATTVTVAVDPPAKETPAAPPVAAEQNSLADARELMNRKFEEAGIEPPRLGTAADEPATEPMRPRQWQAHPQAAYPYPQPPPYGYPTYPPGYGAYPPPPGYMPYYPPPAYYPPPPRY